MSHSLHSTNLQRKRSTARVVSYSYAGPWTESDQRLLQRAMDSGTTSQVEMGRDGLWFNGVPGQKLRDLCAELERRGLRKKRGAQ